MARSAMAKVLLAAAAAAVVTALLALEVVETVELPARDLTLRSLQSEPAAKTIVVAVDEPSLRALGPWPWPRARLAKIVDLASAAGARAVVFDVLLSDPRPDDDLLARSMRQARTATVSVLVENEEWLIPAPLLADATVVAHGNFELDHDGILRRFASTKQSGVRAYTALSLVAAGFERETAVPVGRTIAPAFRTPPRSVPRVSAVDLLSAEAVASRLRGRIVFVGPTALGLGDRVLTPVSRRFAPDPGVTVHAAATESLLRSETIRTLPPLGSGALAFVAVFAILATSGRPRVIRIPLAGALILALLLVSRTMLAAGTALPVVTLLAAILLTAAAVETIRMATSLQAGRAAATRLASGLGMAAPQGDEVGPSLEVIATRLAEERARAVESKRVLAHELKTPLASMRSLTQLMTDFDLNEGERRRVTSLLRTEAGKLQDMVQGLLDLERLPLRDFSASSTVIDIGETVGRRVEFLRAGSGRPLAVMADNGVLVKADAMLIERVIDNLVGNALKYTSAETPVSVRVSREGSDALIEVADRGPGIPEIERTRIFDRFARGSTAAGTDGLGLGLALVAEVVRWHGGNVALDAGGIGSRFVVRLPVVS